MGAWGTKPDEADKAQEWLLPLWEQSSIKKSVEQALVQNVDDYHEEVRMAAFVFYRLRGLLVWDYDEYANLAKQVIVQLQAITALEIYQNEDFQSELKVEIKNLNRLCS